MRETVQVEDPPGEIDVGEQVSVLRVGSEVTVMEAVREEPLAVAVTVTAVLAVTVDAATVKLAEVEPAPTVTEDGVVRAELLSERVTS